MAVPRLKQEPVTVLLNEFPPRVAEAMGEPGSGPLRRQVAAALLEHRRAERAIQAVRASSLEVKEKGDIIALLKTHQTTGAKKVLESCNGDLPTHLRTRVSERNALEFVWAPPKLMHEDKLRVGKLSFTKRIHYPTEANR